MASTLVKNILWFRKQRGFSSAALAHRLHIALARFKGIEEGWMEMHAAELAALQQETRIGADVLLTIDIDEQPAYVQQHFLQGVTPPRCRVRLETPPAATTATPQMKVA